MIWSSTSAASPTKPWLYFLLIWTSVSAAVLDYHTTLVSEEYHNEPAHPCCLALNTVDELHKLSQTFTSINWPPGLLVLSILLVSAVIDPTSSRCSPSPHGDSLPATVESQSSSAELVLRALQSVVSSARVAASLLLHESSVT